MSQKYYELDKEEQKLLESFEAGEWKSEADLTKAKKLFQGYAKATLNKTRNVNLRLPERTLLKLKARAILEGIPYQTLASSVLHKFVA